MSDITSNSPRESSGESIHSQPGNGKSGYYPSPWPCEDGSPQRLQLVNGLAPLNVQAGDRIRTTGRRLFVGNMVLLRNPGEVYLMHHDGVRKSFGMHSHAYLERIHPQTLKPVKKSPQLPGGPFWPGGFAIHRNGDLYLTFGRYMHHLDADCNLLHSRELPQNLPHNSQVILDNGLLVTKPIMEHGSSHLVLLDPQRLDIIAQIEMPEPSISRLSSTGNTLYLTGVSTIYRYHYDDTLQTLLRDEHWQFDYIQGSNQSYGWDPVIEENNVWFMDNGAHTANFSMLNAGIQQTPNNIVRVSTSDAKDASILPVSDLRAGSVTNPPLYCTRRNILLGYDSANRFIRAWKHDTQTNQLKPIWQRYGFGMAGHTLYYAQSGEVVTEDYQKLTSWRGLRYGEESVILDIETGRERARIPLNNYVQSFCFPSPGFDRDYYWLGMDKLTHVMID